MTTIQRIRFIASLGVLCSFVFLAIDLFFYFFVPALRGGWVYIIAQVAAQALIALLMRLGWITIYTGPKS